MDIQDLEIKISGRFVRIAGLSADTYEFVTDPQSIIEALKESGQRVDLFAFMQKLPSTEPTHPYHLEWDNLAVLTVSTFDEWWTKQINDKTRNMARRAGKKGVAVRQACLDDDFIQGIWAIYNECEIRQGKPFPHYGKDLATVRRMMVTYPDRSVFIGAYLDSTLIGFARLHCDASRTQVGVSSLLSLSEHRDKSPTNALLAESVRFCADQGIRHLVYSRYSDGNKKRDSLMDFKDHNGFKRINLPRYFIPLTSVGRIALATGLHRNLTTYVPDPVLAKLRLLRKAWYGRRAESSAESRYAVR